MGRGREGGRGGKEEEGMRRRSERRPGTSSWAPTMERARLCHGQGGRTGPSGAGLHTACEVRPVNNCPRRLWRVICVEGKPIWDRSRRASPSRSLHELARPQSKPAGRDGDAGQLQPAGPAPAPSPAPGQYLPPYFTDARAPTGLGRRMSMFPSVDGATCACSLRDWGSWVVRTRGRTHALAHLGRRPVREKATAVANGPPCGQPALAKTDTTPQSARPT